MSAKPTAREGRILEDLIPVLAPLDLVVEDVSVIPAGKRRVVRILVDRDLAALDPDDATSTVAPLDLDQVAEATRVVSQRLDDGDLMGEQAYVLEVSSPGTDRALCEPRHFRRNVGRLLKVVTTGGETVTGRLLAARPASVSLRVDEGTSETATRDVAHGDIATAHVEIEFNRPDAASGEQGEDD